MAAFSALSLAPDVDVIAFRLGIPYSAPFGHRGAAHSICGALALAFVAAVAARGTPELVDNRQTRLRLRHCRRLPWAARHVDRRRLGIALLWPVSNQRYFAPWRPIPVAPIGARMLTMAGVRVVMTEALQFAPLLVWSLWPRRRSVA